MTGSVGLENGHAAIVSGWVGWPHIYVIFNLLTEAFKIPFRTSKTYVLTSKKSEKKYLLSLISSFSRFVLFLTEEAYSHGSLPTRELGQTPLLYVSY